MQAFIFKEKYMNKESVLGDRSRACDPRAASGLDMGKRRDLSRLLQSMETRTCERWMQRL